MLPKAEAVKVFTTDVKNKLGITLPIVRTYSYADTGGKYYMVLTEKFDGMEVRDTVHKTIKAFNFKSSGEELEKQWEVNDFTRKTENDYPGEISMWFWTRYCIFQDIDKDGITDPILVYGSKVDNGLDNGRVKILVYYKGEKIVIRHQNGVLDDERNTHVDVKFYKLPTVIQKEVTFLIHQIMEDGNAIFPYGWENNMKKHKVEFSESN